MTKTTDWSMRLIPLCILLTAIGVAAAELPAPSESIDPKWFDALKRLKAQHDRDEWKEAEQACDPTMKQLRDSAASPLTVEAFQLRCAMIRADLGRVAEAEAEIRQVLEQRRSRLDERAKATAEAMQYLGNVLLLQGRPEDAATVLRPAIQVYNATIGAGAANTIYANVSFAAALRELGEFGRAESILRQTLKIIEGKAGPQTMLLESLLSCLTSVLIMQGKYAEADAINARALALSELVGEDGTARHAMLLSAAGTIDLMQGRVDESLVHLEQSRDILQRYMQPDNPVWIETIYPLGLVYHKKGRLAEAEAALRRALAIKEAMLGSGSAAVAFVANELAEVLKAEKKKGETRALQAKYGKRRPATRLPPVVSLGDLKKGR